MLHDPSDEQTEVLNSISDHNVVVDAVAGSGKTTTILHIAKRYDKLNVLLLTYNAKLKLETRQKAKQLGLDNLEAHSYHAFCVKYYDRSCFTDSKIIKILSNNNNNSNNKSNISFTYNIVIIDEAQDMTNVYFELVCKVLSEHKVQPKICLLGDRNQSIFEFNNADNRFLIMANKLFDFNSVGWKEHKLSTSFRVTKPIAAFVNNCLLKQNRLVSNKEGARVRYILCDTFGKKFGLNKKMYVPYNEVTTYLKQYKHSDIFILAPSVKSATSPVRILANKLTRAGIPIYVPVSDEERLDEEIIEGKIVFSTYHQVKGLERKVVIVFGFGSTYFQFFKKDKDPYVCPDEIYVAATRAQEQMTILQHYQDDFFKFMDKAKLKEVCHYTEYNKLHHIKMNISNPKPLPVTDLIKHLSSSSIEHAINMLKITKIREPDVVIEIETKSKQDNMYENVTEITGTSIPSYYEYIKTGNITILEHLDSEKARDFLRGEYDFEKGVILYKHHNKYDKKQNEDLNEDDMFTEYGFDDCVEIKESQKSEHNIKADMSFISKFLRMSNHYCAYMSGYSFKTSQITEYNWLTQEHTDSCMNRLNNVLLPDVLTKHEILVSYRDDPILTANCKYLQGAIDCIQGNTFYEFKCVSSVQNEHLLQLVVYGFMYEMMMLKEEKKEHEKLMTHYNKIKFKKGSLVVILLEGSWKDGVVTYVHKNLDLNVKVNNTVYKKCPTVNILHKDYFTAYAQLSQKFSRSDFKYCLYNIITDELYEIATDFEAFKKVVEYLILQKYCSKNRVTDDEFVERFQLIKDVYSCKDDIDTDTDTDTDTDINSNKQNIIVLDIETDGKNKIVEIAYNVYDQDMNLLNIYDILINNGKGITDYYKKITYEEIVATGVSAKEAMIQLSKDFDTTKYVVCHNIAFDMKHIRRYMYDNCVKCHYPIEIDTMLSGRDLVKAKAKNGRLKNPKLEELYTFLFNKKPNLNKCHRGTYDVKITAKCLKKMIDLEAIKL